MFADNSFRIYFHGATFPDGFIFSRSQFPLDRLIVHRANDYMSFFADAVSTLQETENTELIPAAFLLNGRFWRIYF
jgi:hypothetical protein